jgi:hypothetical protein
MRTGRLHPPRLGPGAPPIPTGGLRSADAVAGAAADPAGRAGGRFSGGLLFEKLDQTYFLTLDLQNELNLGPVTFGVWVPRRFKLWGEEEGVIRKKDWTRSPTTPGCCASSRSTWVGSVLQLLTFWG